MIYRTENSVEAANVRLALDLAIKDGAIIEMKKIGKTRTSRQNRALHLFFSIVAKELNDLGITFNYTGVKGAEMETQWTEILVKELMWKGLQEAMFGTKSTTELQREQIDKIFIAINAFFADHGVVVTFPNEFDYYLNYFSNENIQR